MQYWGITDPGCVRAQNQDAYQIEQLGKNTLLCVICDGMGGAKSGNIASTLAIDVFVQEVRRSWSADMDQDAVDQMLQGAVKLANFTVYDQSRQLEEFEGMGTTLVACLAYPAATLILNIGDSRAYHIDADGIRRITTDHSVVELMVIRGELTAEQAKTHPSKNLITRAVGTAKQVLADAFHLHTRTGESILLCSDGLSNQMSDQEILFEVAHGAEKEDCCQRLMEIAKDRGAPDNVTAILIAL